jgi:hypothetical protein
VLVQGAATLMRLSASDKLLCISVTTPPPPFPSTKNQ